jgi:hypothetical protein
LEGFHELLDAALELAEGFVGALVGGFDGEGGGEVAFGEDGAVAVAAEADVDAELAGGGLFLG